MERKQLAKLALIVLFPLILVIALIIINPNYMEHFFKSIGPLNGFSIMVILVILHGLVLFAAAQMAKGRKFPPKALLALTILTCSLPSILVTFLYPSVWLVMQPNAGF